jgi:hypothetical protein
MAEWVSEETAQALARSIDALAERLGRIESQLDEDGPVGSILVQRQESFDNIAKALEQLASRNMPDIVRIAANLDEVKLKLPDLVYATEGLQRLLGLRADLQAIPKAVTELQNLLYGYGDEVKRRMGSEIQVSERIMGELVQSTLEKQEEIHRLQLTEIAAVHAGVAKMNELLEYLRYLDKVFKDRLGYRN